MATLANPSGQSGADEAKLAVVRAMMQAWHDLDWKRVGELFTEDGVLHSMMVPPVVGRAAIAARIAHRASRFGH